MTAKIKKLMKTKDFLEAKIEMNKRLLETIQKFKQDENTIIDENKMYNYLLSLVKKDLRAEYRRI